MRVTTRTLAQTSLQNLQSGMQRMQTLQDQLSSGKLLSRPSDSPTGVASAMQLRSELRAEESYSRNADDALGWLSTADGALTDTSDTLRRVRELALTGANTGTLTSSARQALASEVANLREHLVGLANSTYLGRPVFGGTMGPGASPYSAADSAAYAGDGGAVQRRIAADVTVRVDVPGEQAFGSGASSVFALLDRLAGNLVGNPAALSADIADLDAASTRALNALTTVGTRYARVESGRQGIEDRMLSLRGTLSAVEDVDLPRTITDLKLQETAYEAALSATARSLQPSLLDFIR